MKKLKRIQSNSIKAEQKLKEAQNTFESLIMRKFTEQYQDKKEQVRKLLIEATKLDDQSIIAWWLLSTVVKTPEDEQVCLENVLTLDSGHKDAKERLAQINSTPNEAIHSNSSNIEKAEQKLKDAQKIIRQSIDPQLSPMLYHNKQSEIRSILIDSIRLNDQSAITWWLLSAIVISQDDEQICLENVLRFDPEHKEAKKRLEVTSLKSFVLSRMPKYDIGIPYNKKDEVRREIQELFNIVLAEANVLLSRAERTRLFETVVADLLGFGPLETLLQEEQLTGIFIKDDQTVLKESSGKWETDFRIKFDNQDHLLRMIKRMEKPIHPDYSNEQGSVINTRLLDGSSVDGIISTDPPLMIRRYSKVPLGIDDLIRFGSMTAEIAEFIRACVIAQLNTLVVGGAGTGKDTLINVMSNFIPNDERIITVEDIASYQLHQEHVVTLECDTLLPLAHLLRLRPDRLIFGERTTDNILQFIEACLSVSTYGMLRSRNINSAFRQLEIGLLDTLPDLDLTNARNIISQSIDLIICIQQLADGRRVIAEVLEIKQTQDGSYDNQQLFLFEQTGLENKKVVGQTRPTGILPDFLSKIERAGIILPSSTFFSQRS